MYKPRPKKYTGLSGVGVGFMTLAADKLNLLSASWLYFLLFSGIVLIAWSAFCYFLELIKHVSGRKVTMLPIIGMIITGIAFIGFSLWYFIDNYSLVRGATLNKQEIEITGIAEWNSVYLIGDGRFYKTQKTKKEGEWWIVQNDHVQFTNILKEGSTQYCGIESSKKQMQLIISTDNSKDESITITTKVGPYKFRPNVVRAISMLTGEVE